MTYTLPIGAEDYDVYVLVSQVDAYANGSLTAAEWDSLILPDKARAIVTATRWIDSQCWKGQKIDPAQPLAFPRTVGDIALVQQATIYLALLIAKDPEIADRAIGLVETESGGGTKRLKAGSVEIEYFSNMSFRVYGSGKVDPFPLSVMRLLNAYLCDTRTGAFWGNSGSQSWGTCRDSVTGKRGKFGFTEPF